MKPDGSGIARGAVCYQCPPGKYAYLNGIAVVLEIEFEKEYNNLKKTGNRYRMSGGFWDEPRDLFLFISAARGSGSQGIIEAPIFYVGSCKSLVFSIGGTRHHYP